MQRLLDRLGDARPHLLALAAAVWLIAAAVPDEPPERTAGIAEQADMIVDWTLELLP